MSVTIAADDGGQQRTAADDLVQVRHSKNPANGGS
jgi:hypothetical protein